MTSTSTIDPAAGEAPVRSAPWVEGSFLAMVAAASTLEITSFDIWWHLAAGRQAVEIGAIPQHESFSFTAAGAPWVDHEWLFQLIVFGIHSLLGEPGLVIFRVVMVTLAAAVVLRAAQLTTRWPSAVLCLGLLPFLLAGRGRFLIRPELFTLVFSVILVATLFQRRDEPPTLRQLLWIPVIFVFWANLHAGVILGIVLLTVYTAGLLLHVLSSRLALGLRPLPAGRPGLAASSTLLGLSATATLMNPFGFEIYRVPFHLRDLIATGIFRNAEWDPPSLPFSWLYFSILGFTLVVAAFRWRRLDAPTALALGLLVFLSLRHIRHGAIFGFLAPILLAGICLHHRPPLRPLHPALAATIFLLLASSFALSNPFGFTVDRRILPVDATDWIAEHRPPGQMLNSETFGGFLAWRLGPEVRIFIDGRNEVFADVQRQLYLAEKDQALWNQLLDQYEIGYALLSYANPMQEILVPGTDGEPPKTLRRPFAASHFPRRHWGLVYWDDTAMVYVRRTEATRELIATFEHRHVYPESLEFQLEGLALGRVDPVGLQRELAAKLATHPDSRRARRWLDALITWMDPSVSSNQP